MLCNNIIRESDMQGAYDSLLQQVPNVTNTSDVSSKKNDQVRTTEFLTNNVRLRHIALKFFYDGSNYSGLAENIGMETDNSIEKALFAALKRTRFVESRGTCGYSRCGRTDRGVSSAGQVIALRVKSSIPKDATWDEDGAKLVQDQEIPKNGIDVIRVWVPGKSPTGSRIQKEICEYSYDKILNNVLPPAIRIMGWCPVSDEFSARFSAISRLYRYFFVRRPEMNLDNMREALKLLIGKHDFRNFCKMDVEKVYNFERKIHDAKIVSAGNDVFYFEILGQAFLWHQIRCIVSILFMVGRGQEEPRIVEELLNITKFPGKPSYALAPENPLILHDCAYNDLRIGHTAQNLWSTHCELERQWEEFTLAAARIRNGIDSLFQKEILKQDLHTFLRHRLEERSKKQKKKGNLESDSKDIGAIIDSRLLDCLGEKEHHMLLSWNDALHILKNFEFIPSPTSLREAAHIPLAERQMGTTYEEKIDALTHSKRRFARYDKNVVKKRKSQEEDAEFYNFMMKQGSCDS
jgi:tRNA pseudouridine38/39 synthase